LGVEGEGQTEAHKSSENTQTQTHTESTQTQDQGGQTQTPFALLARRGVCSFSEKASNAQRLGAALLVVANSQDSAFPMGPAPEKMGKEGNLLNVTVMEGEGMKPALVAPGANNDVLVSRKNGLNRIYF